LVRIWKNPNDEDEKKIKADIMREDNLYEVKIEEDIYCLGFLTFLTTDSPKFMSEVVLKSIFTLLFQIMIVVFMMFEYLNVDTSGEGLEVGSLLNDVFYGTPALNLTRIVCCFLLHLSLLPELQSAKSMLDFVRKNPTAFHDQNFEYAFLFASFKGMGGSLCIIANLVILLRSSSIEDVVKDFVAV
jgi:hypothetical protein